MKIDKYLDTLIVGAGFAGMYSLHKQMSDGFKVEIYEQADDVGGTWYWNKYPGARCDIESMDYSYSFSEDLIWFRLLVWVNFVDITKSF